MSPILAALSKDSVLLAPCSRRAWLVLSPNPCEKSMTLVNNKLNYTENNV